MKRYLLLQSETCRASGVSSRGGGRAHVLHHRAAGWDAQAHLAAWIAPDRQSVVAVARCQRSAMR
jgi:hypothetical protein